MTHDPTKCIPPNSADDAAHMTCWVVSDGKAGMENQCLGLARAMGLQPVVKRVKLRFPWKQLIPFFRHGLKYAMSSKSDPIMPPWPNVLIASGRASVAVSLYVRKKSRENGSAGTFTVQIQNPVLDPSRFDLLIVPRHDQLCGQNIMTTRGSLHRVTKELLEEEAKKFLPQVAHLPSPLIAVSIGGSNSVYSLTSKEMKKISDQLAAIAGGEGGLMITTSRRTGAENLKILQEGLKDSPAYIWDGKGPNPYYGMLGLAETILVTCDSVNMVSEACSTGKPVMIIDLPGGSDKFRRFHQAMRDDGMTRPFKGHIERWGYTPLEDMRLAAERVYAMMSER